MNLQGLQKLTLLDFPGKTACTLFTGGCNLRCPFCHNAPLIAPANGGVIDETEFFAFLSTRKGKLDGVAITGGEPLAQKDIADFIKKIRALGFLVKLDTNGFYPNRFKSLLDEHLLDYVAMDLKNSDGKYAATCGLASVDLDKVRRSIELLMDGPADYEFRTTVVAEFHDAADFEEIGKMIRGARRYFLQCFTDRDSVPFGNLHAPAAQDLNTYADIVRPYVPDTSLRGVD